MDRYYLSLILSGIFCGTIVFGGSILSGLGMSVYEISILPFLPFILVLLPLIIFNKKYQTNPKLIPLLIFYGFVEAALVLTQYGSIVLGVPVAMVALLLYTQPVWTLIIAKLFLKEDITKLQLIAAAIVIVGIVVMVNPFGADFSSNLPGIISALIAGVMLSLWLVLGSYISKKGNNIVNTYIMQLGLSILILLLLLPVLSHFIKHPNLVSLSFSWSPLMWLVIVAYGLVGGLLANLLYFEGAKKVPTIDAGIIMLLEPVSAAILAAIFLRQPITLSIAIGGALILFANYMVIAKGAKDSTIHHNNKKSKTTKRK
jgi:drug/metabolite transporter (DMT)-like permease